jgi:hypothetical protein
LHLHDEVFENKVKIRGDNAPPVSEHSESETYLADIFLDFAADFI